MNIDHDKRSHGLGLLLIIVLCITTSCTDSSSHEEEMLRKADNAFEPYWNGNPPVGIKSLENQIRLLESSEISIYRSRKAFILFLQCSRLYVLESKAGNETKANLAFIKAQYWNVRRYEIDGGITEENLPELQSFTKEKLFSMIEKADKAEHARRQSEKSSARGN